MKKAYRVKKERDFQEVFHQGKSFANKKFVVYVLDKPENKHFRIGISVGKKVGNAVERNRVKRLIRAAVYEMKEVLNQQIDFIVIARPAATGIPMEELKKNLIHVLKLANIINRGES